MIARARSRVMIQREVPIADGAGGYAPGWTTLGTVWAEILPTAGREQVEAGGLAAIISHRVRVRRATEVEPAMRLVLSDGRVLNVRAIMDRHPWRPWLELLCEEGVAT
jgi:SPP1 family predicted phage head-tail adaptor